MAKEQILGLNLARFDPSLVPKFFFIHCCKLLLYVISRKTNEPNLRKWRKTNFGPDFGPL